MNSPAATYQLSANPPLAGIPLPGCLHSGGKPLPRLCSGAHAEQRSRALNLWWGFTDWNDLEEMLSHNWSLHFLWLNSTQYATYTAFRILDPLVTIQFVLHTTNYPYFLFSMFILYIVTFLYWFPIILVVIDFHQFPCSIHIIAMYCI